MNIALDGVLDLHQFAPREVNSLVREYLHSCRRAGVLQVRIIHGKGKGVLRERVHALLRQDPGVRDFGLSTDRSSWGATWVDLLPLGESRPLPAPAPASSAPGTGRLPWWYRFLQKCFVKGPR